MSTTPAIDSCFGSASSFFHQGVPFLLSIKGNHTIMEQCRTNPLVCVSSQWLPLRLTLEMATYGYGFRFRGHNNYNGGGTQADEWNKTSYVSNHVSQPVLADSDGKQRPTGGYPTITESYINEKLEQVYAPTANTQSSPTMEKLKNYGYVEDRWTRPPSPVRDRPPSVEEFITKIQTEASRPNRFGVLNSSHWRQSPNSQSQPRLGAIGYGNDYSEYGKKEWIMPSGTPTRNGNYDDYYNKNHNTYSDSTVATSDGWGSGNRATWPTPQTHESTLSQATSDINTALDYLKEASKPFTAPNPRYSAPFSTDPRRERYTETIDSKEGASRYGKLNLGYRANRIGDAYATTIDSREAAMNYNGTRV